MKLITAQLVLHNTAAAAAANASDDQASVDRISDVALKLLESLHIVPGGPTLRLALTILFNLRLLRLHDIIYPSCV